MVIASSYRRATITEREREANKDLEKKRVKSHKYPKNSKLDAIRRKHQKEKGADISLDTAYLSTIDYNYDNRNKTLTVKPLKPLSERVYESAVVKQSQMGPGTQLFLLALFIWFIKKIIDSFGNTKRPIIFR